MRTAVVRPINPVWTIHELLQGKRNERLGRLLTCERRAESDDLFRIPQSGKGGILWGEAMQKSRPTQNKRARERARQERQQQKQARRLEARERKAHAPAAAPGEDPDIAGIVPGPQPNPWGDLDDKE